MNILSYGLLGLLTRDESSGYDLMLRIQPHWQAKHSQIYPILSRMEDEGLLSARWVEQTDKPDKKMYRVTDKGIQKLLDWMYTPVSTPALRDELNLRMICFQVTNPIVMKRWVDERRHWFESRLEYYTSLLSSLPEEAVQPTSPYFGEYIVNTKGIMTAKTGIEWCHWVNALMNTQHQEREATSTH